MIKKLESIDGIAYQTGLPTMELFDDTGGCKGLMEMCEKNEEMGKMVVEDGYGDVGDTRNIPPYAEANFFSIQTFGKFDQNASQSASLTSNSAFRFRYPCFERIEVADESAKRG